VKTLTKTTAKIGKYRLETEIGHDPWGHVFRAFEPTVGRTVAIKVLTGCGEDALPRFNREAATATKLRHKNIAAVYDYGEHDNSPYLVREYLEGITLNTVLSSGPISTLFAKTAFMTQVAEGLQHAHQKGVIHGNLKPVNIMILADGTVKIMDFGLVGVLSEPEMSRTRTGVFDSLSYTAPEILQYSEVDALSDIFSFGVIYYELVTGTHPFAANDRARVIYNITTTEPPLAGTLASQCPRELEQLIARAIHKDRELRYQSFEHVLFDLLPTRLRMQSAEAQSLIRKADTLVDAKQFAEAEPLVEQILQLDPNNRTARDLRERLKREAQQRELREQCKQLIISGTAKLNALHESKAIEMFEAVLRLDPNHLEAQKLLEQARTMVHKRERAQALLVQAKRELEADQLTDAYQKTLECLQHVPGNNAAAALLETIREAIKARERQRRMGKELARAKEMFAAGRLEEAEALLSELELSYPDVLSIKQLTAEVACAVEEKRRRRQLVENLSVVRKLVSKQKWAEAVALLDELLKQFPDEEEVRSLSVIAQGQLELRRKAKHVKSIRRQAISANKAHDFERALQLINEGLRLYPGEPTLNVMLTRTEKLRNEHQRRIAIQAAAERANELAAKNDFPAALMVIDSTASTWNIVELTELRRQIQTKQEEFRRAQAIADACKSIKNHLDNERFEDAISAGQKALGEFPGEPSITAMVNTAQSRLAEQIRQARIDAIYNQAMANATEDRFPEALALLRDAIREVGEERSLIALHEKIEARKKQHERQQAIAAAAAAVRSLIEKSDYEGAAEAGRLALKNFPDETVLTKLGETAKRLLAQQRRAAHIDMVREKARSLASVKDFDSALRLVLDTIDELGYEAVLEDLAHTIERLREQHQEQEARRLAAGNAKQLMDSNEYAKAVALLEENLEKYSDDVTLKSLLEQARQQLAAHQSKAIDAIVRKARELVRSQEFQTALNLVRYGIREYSDDARLNAMVTEIKTAIFEAEKERTIRAALDSAAVLQEHGEFRKAAELLEHTLTKAPGQTVIEQALDFAKQKLVAQQKIDAILDTVRKLMSRGNVDEALAKVHQALVASPAEPSLCSLFEEISELQRSTAIAAASREVQACCSSGDFVAASRMLEQALASFPNDPTLLAFKSRIQSDIEKEQKHQHLSVFAAEIRHLLDEEKIDDAIHRLQDGLRESPESVELTGLYAYAKEVVEAQRAEEERTLVSPLDRARSEIAVSRADNARLDLGPDLEDEGALGVGDTETQPNSARRFQIPLLVGIVVVMLLLAWIVLPHGKKRQSQGQESQGTLQKTLNSNSDNQKEKSLREEIESASDADTTLADHGRRMNQELSKWAQTKADSERPAASQLKSRPFAAAQRAGDESLNRPQLDFDEEDRASEDGENQQKATTQLQRIQAQTARVQYEKNRAKATNAEAETKAGDSFQTASRLASDAQARFDRGDFAGAYSEFEQAALGMVRAATSALSGHHTIQHTMDLARTEMETAKRALSGTDGRSRTEEIRAQQLAQEGKLNEATIAYQRAASFYRDAAQRESGLRDEIERRAIRDCLNNYKVAYEQKDLAAMRAVFPKLSGVEERAVRNNLEIARLIDMMLVVNEIQIYGAAARAVVRQQLNVRTTDDKTVQSPQASMVFNLYKLNGSWVIDSINR